MSFVLNGESICAVELDNNLKTQKSFNGVCENAVNEPIIDMQLKGNSEQGNLINIYKGELINSIYGIDISNLIIGETYTIISDKELTMIKISSKHDSYNSVTSDFVQDSTFTMARHEDIPSSATQYLFIKYDKAWVTNADTIKDCNIRIVTTKPTASTPVEIESVGEKTSNLVNIADMNITLQNQYYKNTIPDNPYVLLEPNTTYTLSFDRNILMTDTYISYSVGYGNKTYSMDISTAIPLLTDTHMVHTFTTPSDFGDVETPYLALRLVRLNSKGNVNVNVSNIKLEKGEVETAYEPFGYKIPIKVNETVTNIYLNEPLRKIGDYADYIDYKNKKVIRNIFYERITVVSSRSSDSGTYSKFLANISKKPLLIGTGVQSIGYAISDKFVRSAYQYRYLQGYPNRIQPYRTGGGLDRIVFTFDDPAINTVELAQQKIGDGFDVCYALESPTVEDINISTISTFNGDTIFNVPTLVEPSKIEIEYWINEPVIKRRKLWLNT